MATLPGNTQSSAIVLPPMGLGAWAWGDSIFWGCKLFATNWRMTPPLDRRILTHKHCFE
jgi:hypothetical protein